MPLDDSIVNGEFLFIMLLQNMTHIFIHIFLSLKNGLG